MNQNTLKKILQHPDKDEIISKLVSGKSSSDIHEWLEAKYVNVGESKFILSDNSISVFQKKHLDFYNIIKEDLAAVKGNNLSAEDELNEAIQSNPTYHKKLNEYIDSEIDIKVIVKRMVVAVEARAAQVFDQIQEDPRNIKMDRVLIEWFNTLTNMLEKYDVILNGSPDQINIQNNVNIQILDQHIGVIYNIIKEILSKLDYDTSLMFIDMFNEEMKKIKPIPEKEGLPVEMRLAEAKDLDNVISSKIDT